MIQLTWNGQNFLLIEYKIIMDSENKLKKIKLAVVLVDRANYGRLKPVMLELKSRKDVKLNVVCSGTMMLDRFGVAADVVERDGFEVGEKLYVELEGSRPETMSKSIGLGIIEFTNAFQRIDPDFVLIIGDRYEALSAAISAAFQNICIIHLQGGEVSGSIDESTRHAITKFSHYHFPATKRAGKYVVAMGEDPDTVFALGCPSADLVATSDKHISKELLDHLGVGPHIDLNHPYFLILFHPVTSEFEAAEKEMDELLQSIAEINIQTIVLWPNIDAGSDGVSQAVRRFREHNHQFPLHVYKNFEPQKYIPILANAAVAIGNSSSFVRDASFLGTPIVLVGNRQDGREWSEAVMRVEPIREQIIPAVKKQMHSGRFAPSDLYGKPGVSKVVVDQICKLIPYSQKKLYYYSIDSKSQKQATRKDA